ncbi:g325 [Coccomyxa elongata]
MGRTVRIRGDHESNSASDQSQTSDSGIEDLLDLLPDLAEQLRLNKPLSLRLSKDIPGIVMKLVKLREIFPDSNVLKMVGKRLSMLLDEEFSLIEGNLEKLQATLPGADVVSLVEQQPLFLFEDMEVILAELRSLRQPGKSMQETVALVGKDPKLAGCFLEIRRCTYPEILDY